jgi:hypothetical protein
LPPLECCLGTMPIQVEKLRPDREAFGSATVATRAVASVEPRPSGAPNPGRAVGHAADFVSAKFFGRRRRAARGRRRRPLAASLEHGGRALPPGRSQLHGDELVWPLSLRFTRAHEAEPSAAANPARALGRAAGDFFLTDWLAAAAVAAASEAAASEVGGQLRQDGIATARAWLAAPRANAPIAAARRSQLPRR